MSKSAPSVGSVWNTGVRLVGKKDRMDAPHENLSRAAVLTEQNTMDLLCLE